MEGYFTKADWLGAEQCPAQAWFALRGIQTAPSEADLFQMEQGQEVGHLARELYPNGVLVSPRDGKSAQDVTTEVLTDASVDTLFEAAFRSGSYVAKADIIRRVDGGWHVLEVKSSFSDTNEIEKLIDDLAYTLMVLRGAGLRIARASLVLLSREYRHGEAVDGLFEILDQTDEADERASLYADSAEKIANALLADEPPKAVLSSACRSCEFFAEKCLGAGLEHTVLEIPNLNHKKLQRLSAGHIINLSNVPDTFQLNEQQVRAKRAALSGSIVVEPGLAVALRSIEWPCRYLDFETVKSSLPLYRGHHCHQQVLTQFSIHCRDSADAEPTHVDFLADARRDCERELAEALIEGLGDHGSVLVYSTFEASRIRALQRSFPDLAGRLQMIRDRLVDLLPLIADNVYHPSFRGSFSIKRVLPALVPGLSYADLEVADGFTAVARFARIARGECSERVVSSTRHHLLEYCKLDTLAMVRLHEALSKLALQRRSASA